MLNIYTTSWFDRWLAQISDRMTARRIQARIDRAEDGHFGDYRHISDRVFEMRLHFGPGYRIYFFQKGERIVVLLGGGDKTTQAKDISKAVELAQCLEDDDD